MGIAALLTLPSLAAPHKRAASAVPASSDSKDLLDWRIQRAHTLSAPDGWLTLVGLEWLKPGRNSIGLAPDNDIRLKGQAPQHLAVIDVQGAQLKLLAPQGALPAGFPAHFLVNGQSAQEGPIQPDDTHPSLLTHDNFSFVVLHRGDRYALRIKDAESPTRTSFRGLHWYAPDPRFRLTARWIPFTPPHQEKIPTVLGTSLDLTAPGLAEFTLDGKTIQLEPVLEDPNAKQLFFILRDATSKTTTYQSARFLYAEIPDHGLDQPGTLTLDFNRLQNPPCAYTPYATCPLPPYINRLAIPIPAGEQRYSK